MVPQKASSMFVGKAKQDGKIIAIDDKIKVITVKYKDKSTDVIEYGKKRGDAAGSYLEHDIVLADGIKPGIQVKEGQILAYHAGFFKQDPITKNIAWSHGVSATVALMAKDVTLEDSNMITADFAEKL